MNALPVYALCRHRVMTDGFGVTTLVAVWGCPLACEYCINPEARDISTRITEYTPEQLYGELMKDDIYFQATGGGVTFGGGEPLLHADFIREFISLVDGRWKVNIETSLNVPAENAIVYADSYITDIKDMDAGIYKSYAHGDVNIVISNLKRVVSEVGASRVTARVPLIKNYNTSEHTQNSLRALKVLGISHIDEFSYVLKEK